MGTNSGCGKVTPNTEAARRAAKRQRGVARRQLLGMAAWSKVRKKRTESVSGQRVVGAGSKAGGELCIGNRRTAATGALTTAERFADAKAGLVKLRLGGSGGPTKDGSNFTVLVAVDIVKKKS